MIKRSNQTWNATGELLTDKHVRSLFHFVLAWQPQNVRPLRWETDPRSCNN